MFTETYASPFSTVFAQTLTSPSDEETSTLEMLDDLEMTDNLEVD